VATDRRNNKDRREIGHRADKAAGYEASSETTAFVDRRLKRLAFVRGV
jgi:hypothetical protein